MPDQRTLLLRDRPAHSHNLAALDAKELLAKLRNLKLQAGRSWKTLRLACREQLGQKVRFSTASVAVASQRLMRRITREVGLTAAEILAWMDAEGLGQE
jgi:hypothetical protein